MNIHFICRGNVFRSLTAEAYVKSLQLDNVNALSSGTNVNMDDPQEREYFANTIALLKRHGIDMFAKDRSDQLTRDRLDSANDIVVCMNQRVIDEANQLVTLPVDVLNWSVVDIGEGNRTDLSKREEYEEEVFQEIKQRVDSLLNIAQ